RLSGNSEVRPRHRRGHSTGYTADPATKNPFIIQPQGWEFGSGGSGTTTTTIGSGTASTTSSSASAALAAAAAAAGGG
ncbi:unnamed protein product, partial [Pylaiella littoralis]